MSTGDTLRFRIAELQEQLEGSRSVQNKLASLAGELRVALQAERMRREAVERDLSALRAENLNLIIAVSDYGVKLSPAYPESPTSDDCVPTARFCSTPNE